MALEVSRFRLDVTPPMGHALCGGWIKPVTAVDDPLEAIGFVLYGAGDPIVVCSFDWCGILNSAHAELRERWAEAAGTTAERVTVHTVHQHNAPFACLDAQRVAAKYPELPAILDLKYWNDCVERGSAAIRASSSERIPITQLKLGSATVERIASNRRFLNAEGKVSKWRGSSTRDAALQELPEGLIDPALKALSLCRGDDEVVTLYHYATHPMSYYGDGRVTADFAGLARRRRQSETKSHLLYWTGCAGNIAPGKYNEGTPESRKQLTDRLHDAMQRSHQSMESAAIERVDWSSASFLAPPRETLDGSELERQIGDASRSLVLRLRPAMQWAWLKRWEKKKPEIVVSGLRINQAQTVHLPGECFVEYQLRVAEQFPDRWSMVAAYGDGGPWYIPIASCYPQGGYEVEQAFCDATVDDRMSEAITKVLQG